MTVLYIVNTATGPGTGYGSLAPVAPATSVFSAAAGWKVGTNTSSTGNSTPLFGSIQAVGTFTAATALATNFATTTVNLTTGNIWRSILPLKGSYSSATAWNLSLAFCAVSTSSSQTGRIRTRLWKSASTAGATATQLTIATAAGFITGTTSAVLSKTTASASFSSATWTPTGIPSFNNEYLFVQQEWNIVAAGGLATADSYFVGGATWSQITTSLFTHTDTVTESVAPADTQTSKLNPARATISESVAAADSVSAKVISTRAVSESVAAADSPNADTNPGPIWSLGPVQFDRAGEWFTWYRDESELQQGIISAAGNTYSVTIAESVSITDTLNYLVAGVYRPARFDSRAHWWKWYSDEGQVQQSAITIAAPSVQTIAESVAIADHVDVKRPSNISESVTIADTVDAGIIQNIPRLALTASLRFRPYYVQTDITRRRSGPVVWTDTVAESVSINDTQSYIAYDLIAAKLFDSQLFPRYYPQTFVERKRSVAATLLQSITESVAANDTLTAKANPARVTISESVAPADTVTAKLNPARATISESVAAADTVNATKASATQTLSESVTPADTYAAVRIRNVALAESVTPADTQSAKYTGRAVVAETLGPNDIVTAKFRTLGLVNEVVLTVDLYRYPVTQTGTVSESLSIQDLLDGFNPRGLDTHDGVTKRRRKKGAKYDPFAEETAYRQKLKSDLDKAIHPVTEAPIVEAPVIEAPKVKPAPEVDRYAEIARRLNEVGDYVGLARRQIIDKIHREQELSYAESRRAADAMLRQMQAEREAEEEEESELQLILKDIYG